jgi:hypothetical protein
MADLEMQLIALLEAMVDRQMGPVELKKRLAAMQDPRVADWGYNFKIADIKLTRDPVTTETGPGVAFHRVRIDLVTNYERGALPPEPPASSAIARRHGLLGRGS